MSTPGHTIPLPARLDLPAAEALAQALRPHIGERARLDATACESIGTPGLQVLLSAARSWREAGAPLSVDGLNAGCTGQLAHFGLTIEDISSSGNDA